MRTWSNLGHPLQQTPAKSSLSEARAKISYEFFEDVFRKDLALFSESKSKRKTWAGYHLYAIDGDQYDLPASQDILDHGYRGWPGRDHQETHYPKMYTAAALDLLSGEVREFAFSNKQHEVHLARAMVPAFEPNSIAIYDRLYCGYETFRAHFDQASYFIVRARAETHQSDGKSRGVQGSVKEFFYSKRLDQEIIWRPQPGEIRKREVDINVRAVKTKNKKTNQKYVFITNLPKEKFGRKQINEIYRKRWEVETVFKDLTTTLKMTQWHSKSLNGILQEIYALLWLVNNVKRAMFELSENKTPDRLLARIYKKANFKLLTEAIVNSIDLLIQGRWRKLLKLLRFIVDRTTEKRLRDSRSYERCVKHRGREYKQRNLVPRRKPA